MLNNYEYFIALAEERSFSKAAERLFISHQSLSKYLKNLEREHHIVFFERLPKITLTPAGQVYLETARQLQLLESNLNSQLDDIRQTKKGTIRFGTTEGRFRVLVPDFLTEFRKLYPDVVLETQYGTTSQLSTAILENALDIALLNQSVEPNKHLDIRPILEEQMYLVISEKMLSAYFFEEYPRCKREFSDGVDLAHFQHVPFVVSPKQMNSRESLDAYLKSRQLTLNIVAEMTQTDLQYMLAARDYAASFCWSMYIPSIQQINRANPDNYLHVFPLRDGTITNQLMIVKQKGKILPSYSRSFIQMAAKRCQLFGSAEPGDPR